MSLPRTSNLLRRRERSDNPDASTPAEFPIITHPFFNTMFCTRMAVPQLLKLTDTNGLYVDSPLSEWMKRIEGYHSTADLRYSVYPDFMSMLRRLMNIVAVLVVACGEQKHDRVLKEIKIILGVLCWTKYAMTKQRFMFGDHCPANDYCPPTPLVAFWRYEDMQKVSETTAAPGSIKGLINSMFEGQMATGTLEDCAGVYNYIMSRLSIWDRSREDSISLSLFAYGIQAVFLRALHYFFPSIIRTDDHRETLSTYWSCTAHRVIECNFQTSLMMPNQIDPEQLDTVARQTVDMWKTRKSQEKMKVVSQTYVPVVFKGYSNIGILANKLEVLAPNHGQAKGEKELAAERRKLPYQPKFYNACVYWRLLVELWDPDTPVIQADWCTEERMRILEDIYTKATRKSKVHGKSVATFDKAAEPAKVRSVQRLTSKQMRDELEEKSRVSRQRVKARIERKLHTELEKRRKRAVESSSDKDDDDDGKDDGEAALMFPMLATPAKKEKDSTPEKKQKSTTASTTTKKRKRVPRQWLNSKSDHHLQCLQLIQQLKFDVVQCLPYYARIILMCNAGSCHAEPPLFAKTPQEQAMANPEKMPLQTHTRKKRRTYSTASKKKKEDTTAEQKKNKAKDHDSVSVVKKPTPTGPIRPFILRLFQTTVNDPVWREPILAHKDVASALVLCRERETKQFQFAFSVPRDLHKGFSFRFWSLPGDLPITESPRAYNALNPKSGWGDNTLTKILDDGDWGQWRCVFCTTVYVNKTFPNAVPRDSSPDTSDANDLVLWRFHADFTCVMPRRYKPLTDLERELITNRKTFQRLAQRDLITWFMVLKIIYIETEDAYLELRLIRPTFTPWTLERAFVKYDAMMRETLAKKSDEKDTALASEWLRNCDGDWRILDHKESESKYHRNPYLNRLFDYTARSIGDLESAIHATENIDLNDASESLEDLSAAIDRIQGHLASRRCVIDENDRRIGV